MRSLTIALVAGLCGAAAVSLVAPSSPTFARNAAESLPADSIALQGTHDASPLTLRQVEGRLAWSDRASDRVYSQGVVHLSPIMNALMEQPELVAEREALKNELAAAEKTYQEELAGLRERGERLNQESPAFRGAYEQYMTATDRYRAWQEEAVQRSGKLDASHLERVYRQLLDAIDRVAAREQIDLVHRFVPRDEPFGAENPQQAMNAIRLRPLLRIPSGLDLTEQVMAELGLRPR